MVLYLARTPPQVCAPTRHNHQFFPFVGFSRFWPKFFKTPCVPDGCIYRSNFFGKETQVPKLCFDAIWGKKKISKILRLNSKGKVAIWPFWDRFSSAKKVFLTCYGTSSKHHRRCLEVQRTRLKRFLILEHRWGL